MLIRCSRQQLPHQMQITDRGQEVGGGDRAERREQRLSVFANRETCTNAGWLAGAGVAPGALPMWHVET